MDDIPSPRAAPGQRGGMAEPEPDDDDVVWVMVVRGKRTALIMSSIEFVGTLVSFSLVADSGVPLGSQFMFVMVIITFFSCGIFLIPPYLRKFLNRFKSVAEKSRLLVLAIALWSFLVSLLTFLSAIVASRTFEECRNLVHLGPGGCAKMQAAISIAFFVSIATMGSFLVVFLGSVIPRDITVKTYVRGLGRAATLAAARGASGRVVDGGFESIPLDVVVHTSRSFSADSTHEWNMSSNNRDALNRSENMSLVGRNNPHEESLDMTGDDNDALSVNEDRKSVDAMDII